MSAVKDLKYYLAHPDEMPTDTKEIERLSSEAISQSLAGGTEQLTVDTFVPPEDKVDEPKTEPAKAEEVKAEPAKAVETEAKVEPPKVEELAKAETKPDGVLAKDGKNFIPYSQLESARARASAAEAIAREQAAEIERLKTAQTPPPGEVEKLTDEELQALEADSPTLAKLLRAQQDSIQRLTEHVQQLTVNVNDRTANEVEVVKSEIQTAIDGNTTLAAWQTAEDQTLWNEASRFDKLLRESPAYANVPFAKRFEKVVELTQSALGITPEPVDTPPEDPKPDTPAPTQAQVKAAAEATLKKAQAAAKPRSLSDIPGGAPPAVDERQKVEEMSAAALGSQFLGMSRDQIDAYLANL